MKKQCMTIYKSTNKSVFFGVIFLCLSSFHNSQCIAQAAFTHAGGAHTVGLARAGVNLLGIEGAYCNQAGLTEIRNFAIDVSVEKRFNLDELMIYSIASAVHVKGNTIGFMMSGFGFSEYNEQKFGILYARKLNAVISAGGQLSLLRYNLSGFESTTTAAIEMGMMVKLSNEFSWAGHIFAPGDGELQGGLFKGTRLRMGVKYNPSEKVGIMADIEKRVDKFPAFMVGLVYQMNESFGVRIGVNPRLRLFGFGFAVSFKDRYKLVTSAGMNDVIGNTPAVSMQYNSF
jgi:hypothetical protein